MKLLGFKLFQTALYLLVLRIHSINMVGNAVPPIMAKVIARTLAQLLDVANDQHGGLLNGGFLDNRATESNDVQNRLEEHSSRNDRKEVSA